MTRVPPARPLYLDIAPGPIFGIFHEAAAAVSDRAAVLLCPPWGWDDVTSYRSRRAWAKYLAENGHPALRIDFPAAGDSAGWPSDPARLEAWSETIVAATTWLAGSTGRGRVAVVGLGLGGMIAARALADGAPIDDLVLWAAPARGRAFLREQRAFANMQSSRQGVTGEAEPTLLPDGWLQVGGFVLSAETIAGIERLELGRIEPGRLQRALLLDRDGMAFDAALKEHLEKAGVEVTLAPGNGWGAMCFHPERYSPPLEVFGRVGSWLAAAPGSGVALAAPVKLLPPPPRVDDHGDFVIEGARIRETPMSYDHPFGRTFGLLAEPVDAARCDLFAVLLNAGAVRRIGPNRMYVEAGRRWAAKGIPTLRIDAEGIGDADGDAGMYVDVGRFYTADRGDQLRAILDALEAAGFGPRFVLIGLCAGGYWAFNTAADDKRVVMAVVLNARALVWDPELEMRREARRVERLMEPAFLRRVVRGDFPVTRLLGVGRAAAVQTWKTALRLPSRLRDRRRVEPLTAQLEGTLDRLRDTGTRVVLAFSGEEPVHDELEDGGILSRMDRWPNVLVEHLPGRDHTVRPIVAQKAVHDLLDRELSALAGGPADPRTTLANYSPCPVGPSGPQQPTDVPPTWLPVE